MTRLFLMDGSIYLVDNTPLQTFSSTIAILKKVTPTGLFFLLRCANMCLNEWPDANNIEEHRSMLGMSASRCIQEHVFRYQPLSLVLFVLFCFSTSQTIRSSSFLGTWNHFSLSEALVFQSLKTLKSTDSIACDWRSTAFNPFSDYQTSRIPSNRQFFFSVPVDPFAVQSVWWHLRPAWYC